MPMFARVNEPTQSTDMSIAPSRAGDPAQQLVAQRIRQRTFYVRALMIFAASRLVVLAAVNFGTLLVRDPAPGKWDGGQAWYYRLARWDSGWYASAMDGYKFSTDPGAHNSVVFFPLYPIAARLVRAICGTDSYVALLLVANVSSVAAALLFARLARDEISDEAALLAVGIFSLYPSSVFLSAGYSESLCLVFVLASLILMRRSQYVPSSLAGGIATACRSTSIALVPALLWSIWESAAKPRTRAFPKMALCAALCVSGMLAYAIYLWIAFDHPLAFVAGQNAWHSRTLVHRIIAGFTLSAFNLAQWRDGANLVLFFALAVAAFWRISTPLAIYGLSAVLVPYFLDGITPSTGRYLLMSVPVFIVAAAAAQRQPWMVGVLMSILGALLFRKAALFSQWYWEG
jgi:hypothetical protein